MAQQTAMQKLIEHLSPEQNGIKLLAKSLLKKEKEQLTDAYCDGFVKGSEGDRLLSEEYYNETYNK